MRAWALYGYFSSLGTMRVSARSLFPPLSFFLSFTSLPFSLSAMPFVIPGQPEDAPTLVKSVKLGPYFRYYSRNLSSTIQAATRATVPTHLALDGWSAAVQCFDAMLPINQKLQFDPIISCLLSKTVSPREVVRFLPLSPSKLLGCF